MPPEGGGLFIVYADGDDASHGVEGVLVVCDPWPTEHVCEDDDSTCSDPHTEQSKFHEPKHHSLGNIPASKPKPWLGDVAPERVIVVGERVQYTRKEMLQTEQQ